MSQLSQEKKMIKSAFLIAGLLASSAWAGNSLSDVQVAATATGVDVTVKCASPPVFNVFRLKDPDRLVVDVSNATVDAIKGHHEGLGPVTGVVASQFADDKAQVGRLLLGLANAKRYDVKAIDKAIIISIEGDVQKSAVVAAAAPAAPAPIVEQVAEPKAAAPVAQVARPAVPGETIIASRIDEKPVKKAATRLNKIAAAKGGLRLTTDGEIAKFEVIELADPPRLALDLYGLKSSAKAKGLNLPDVRDVRIGAHDDKVRVVVEFNAQRGFEVARKSDGLQISLSEKAAASAETAEAEIDGAPVVLEGQSAPVENNNGPTAEVLGVNFKESSAGGTVSIKLRGATNWQVERPDGKSAVLNLDNAHIARQLERSLDTGALGTPVKMVSVFAVPGSGDRVRLVVAADRSVEQVVVEKPGTLEWKLTAAGVAEQLVAENRSAGFQEEATDVVEEGAPQQRRNYVGKRVSFEFKDIDIHNLLRIIAEISKKNIVVADDVGGKVTVRLRNVPWDQALDLVLRSKSLGKEEFGNIIRVAPLKTLEDEAKSRKERQKARDESAPLSVTLVPVNYATAGDMATRVKEVLSARGNVAVDTRTNTLIVRDLPENTAKARSLVASLDLQTPQVLIESRIVEASTTFRREVGIQWGGRGIMGSAFGNPTGLAFPSSVGIVGGAVPQGANGNPQNSNYAVSLPVGAGEGSGGALGMTFGSITQAVELNLRLSALEAQGSVKTISAPKVTTLDNATARISQGVSIPFSQVSAAGANTQFVEARLSLEVTPHITQDGSVLMAIRAENNQPDPANTGANGQPGITRKEANTNVLVKDGETTVLGGIYVRATSTNSSGLPILSKIPVLGFFFRNSRELETKNELLVFVTPRILNRAAVAQNP
ncbi:MAG: type IV pilus secretin PilQ [Archangium sp.]|nr:type IV pilus secretin PilQ [Archangium sp.]